MNLTQVNLTPSAAEQHAIFSGSRVESLEEKAKKVQLRISSITKGREVEVKSLLLIVHTKKSFWLLKHNNYCLFVHWTWKLETMKALKLFGLFFIYLRLAKSFAEDLSSGHSFFAALDESQKVKLYWNVDTAGKERDFFYSGSPNNWMGRLWNFHRSGKDARSWYCYRLGERWKAILQGNLDSREGNKRIIICVS